MGDVKFEINRIKYKFLQLRKRIFLIFEKPQTVRLGAIIAVTVLCGIVLAMEVGGICLLFDNFSLRLYYRLLVGGMMISLPINVWLFTKGNK